jgi:cation:H+ antiporter
MLEILFLIIGLIGLWLSAELAIKGALNIAEHYKISHLFIGLTVFAIGTDLPEIVVDVTGAVHKLKGTDTSGLIVGETIGTCFGQIALTLGILGLFSTLYLTKKELLRDGLMMVGSIILLFIVSLDGLISRIDGIIFILIYILYFLALYREEKVFDKIKRAPGLNLYWDSLLLISGILLLILSSNLVVVNAVLVAEEFEIKQSLIGIIVVGLGTSLPELTLSIGALRKKAYKLSVGNLIGSNIFDVLITLGIGAAIAEFFVSKNLLQFDIPFLFITSGLVIMFFRNQLKIIRTESLILIGIYAAYFGLKIAGA